MIKGKRGYTLRILVRVYALENCALRMTEIYSYMKYQQCVAIGMTFLKIYVYLLGPGICFGVFQGNVPVEIVYLYQILTTESRSHAEIKILL